MRTLVRLTQTALAVLGVSFGGAIQANAAISVGPSGTGVLTFDTRPAATEWATAVLPGTATTYMDEAGLDGGVATLVAANITTQLPTSATVPPSTSSLGMRYNTALLLIQSRPTTSSTNAAGVLLATLQNDAGGDKSTLVVGYDQGLDNATGGELPGFRVYYSLTGEANSWVNIPELSGALGIGPVSATIVFTSPWTAGSRLYLLWADDNANDFTDESYTIDNFVAGAALVPLTLTLQPTNITVLQGRTGSLVVEATGSGPITYQWYKDSFPIDGVTVNATANSATFVITNMSFAEQGQYFCRLNNPVSQADSDTVLVLFEQDLQAPQCLHAYLSARDDGLLTSEITAEFSEPLDPATIDLFSIVITEAAGGLDLALSDANVVNETNLVISVGQLPVAGASYVFKPNGVGDPYGNNVTADSQLIPVLLYDWLIMVSGPTQVWRVNDSGTDLGTDWMQPGYDDTGAGWRSGFGVFDGKRIDGSEPCRAALPDLFVPQTPVDTCITISNVTADAQIPAVYFRTKFNYSGPTSGILVFLEHVNDDGAVFYLNGQEIHRFGIAAGPVTYDTLASRTQNDDVDYWFTNRVEAGSTLFQALVQGENTVAAELHQVNLTSSDLSFALRIRALLPEPPAEAPVVTVRRTDGGVAVEWNSGVLQSSPLVTGPWTDVPGSPTSPYTTPATGDQTYFRSRQ